MYIDRLLRLLGGFFVLLSLLLAWRFSHYWLAFTAFVGLNLFQSGFTNWCPMVWLLRRLGVSELPPD